MLGQLLCRLGYHTHARPAKDGHAWFVLKCARCGATIIKAE